MDFRDVCELNDYWQARPPSHVSLSGLVKFKDTSPATAEPTPMNPAETMLMNKRARPFHALPTNVRRWVKEVRSNVG